MITQEQIAKHTFKGLNWKQPYGSAMLKGKVETRVWPTHYRGWVLMIASQKGYTDAEILGISGNEQYGRINTICPTNDNLGKAFAIGRLVSCLRMEPQDEDLTYVQFKKPWIQVSEKTGKKRLMRLWCHIYLDVVAIEPFEIKGAQRWKTITDDIKAKIKIKNAQNQD